MYGFAESPMRKGRMYRGGRTQVSPYEKTGNVRRWTGYGGRMISAPTALNAVPAKNVGETCGLPLRADNIRPYEMGREMSR